VQQTECAVEAAPTRSLKMGRSGDETEKGDTLKELVFDTKPGDN